MRLLRLATLILTLAVGSIGLYGAPASATPLSGATAAGTSSQLADPLIEKSYYGYRRHYWRPRYYYRPRYYRPRYYYHRRYYRPRYFYRPRYYYRRYW